MDLLEQRAYRCLRHMKPYIDLISSSATPPDWIDDVKLGDGEYPIGVYVPVADEPIESIVVSSRGFHLERDGSWRFIGYEEMYRGILPEEFVRGENKLRTNRFTLRLRSGEELDVPIRKHHWKFSDVFEFMRFILDVRSDIDEGLIVIQ